MDIPINSVKYWQNYEKRKNKEVLNFSKNKKMEAKFKELLEDMKKKANV